DVHARLALLGASGGAPRVRACASALRALGCGGELRPGEGHPTPLRPCPDERLREWSRAEEHCERRATRWALRHCAQEVAALGVQWGAELRLLQAELDFRGRRPAAGAGARARAGRAATAEKTRARAEGVRFGTTRLCAEPASDLPSKASFFPDCS
ncbi:unnamed protein product, partial [Prorocentrum cordatum]